MKPRTRLLSLNSWTPKQPGGRWIWFLCLGMTPVMAANDAGVENPAGTLTFSGNQAEGINVSSGIGTVNVQNISGGGITPINDHAGVVLSSNSAKDLTINVGITGATFGVTTKGNNATGIAATSIGSPAPPQNDPFLGIPLPTSQNVSGGAVEINNKANVTLQGSLGYGIWAQSSTTGYPPQVAQQLASFNAAPFSFVVSGVKNANGTDGTIGNAVTASAADGNGQIVPGAPSPGTVTLTAGGAATFTPGAGFSNLANGTVVNVRVNYKVTGTKAGSNPLLTKDSDGFLILKVTKTSTGFSQEVVGSQFAEFGVSANGLPNLANYVSSLLNTVSAGGNGNSVKVTNSGIVDTGNNGSYGIFATSQGGRGGDGRDASITDSSTRGGDGRQGGMVTVVQNGSIITRSNDASGVVAWSVGGDGGTGGDSGYTRNSKGGGAGGTGGDVNVSGNGTIQTGGLRSSGIVAVSQGGSGGAGGDGSTFNSADVGGAGGRGGIVNVNGSWNINTTGDQAHGIWAKSVGGGAGGGGAGGWTGTSAGGGGSGTAGGDVTVVSAGTISTTGSHSYGIYAESIGGFGGNGGGAGSIFYASGGNGSGAGSGGNVSVTNGLLGSSTAGKITTTGIQAHGIFAQSVGGGGGSGGGSGALVALGGSGGSGGDGGTAHVTNYGTITTSGAGSRGIYAQSIGGGGGDGGDAGALVAIGGNASGTSNSNIVTVANAGTISSSSNAIFAQSVGGGGGSGGSSVGWFSFGGKGDGGGDAGKVFVSSKGDLTTTESNASAIFAQSLGGGGGNGGNSTAVGLVGSLAIGGSAKEGGDGKTVKVGVNTTTEAIDAVTGVIKTTGDYSRGIQAQSIGGGGGNGGYAASITVNPISGGPSAAVGLGGTAGGGGIAGDVSIYAGDSNTKISTGGQDSHGIFAQSVGGGGGTGGFAVAIAAGLGFNASVAIGGSGGTGNAAGAVNIGDSTHQTLGTITTTGLHSYGIFAQSVGGGGGDGGFSVSANAGLGGIGASFGLGGSGATGGEGKNVSLYSGSTVTTTEDDSHGIFAQSIGGGGGSGGFNVSGGINTGAVNVGFGGSGGSGGISGDVVLSSTGSQITTGGDHSYGVVAQSIGGGGGDGGFSVSAGITFAPSVGFSMGGSAGGGNKSGNVTLTNSSSVTTTGNDSHALFAQSVGGGGGSGGFSVAGSIALGGGGSGAVNASIGGKGSAGGNAGNVTLSSTGALLKTTLNHSSGIVAQSIGGGGGDGGFSIAGSISSGPAVGFSMGGAGDSGGDGALVVLHSSSDITTEGNNSHGILAQSVGGGGGSGGFSAAGSVSSGSAGVTASVGGNGSQGGDGKKVTVGETTAISGTIRTSGDNSYGVLAQSIGGGGGDGGFSVGLGLSSSAAVNFGLGGSGDKAGLGGEVLLNSAAKVYTDGLNSHGLFAQSVGGGGGSGGFSIVGGVSSSSSAIGASIGGGGAGGGQSDKVTLNSTGISILTIQNHSNGIHAQSIGGGGGDGGFSITAGVSESAAVNFSLGGSADGGGPGGIVVVTNSSQIETRGDDSHAIFAQSVGGGGGSGGFSMSGSGSSKGAAIGATIGGSGDGGGGGNAVTVTSTGEFLTTSGDHSDGIHAQSVGGGGGDGGFSIGISATQAEANSASFAIGGWGGEGGNADKVTVINDSFISTSGSVSNGLFAQSVGGGGGSGGFALSGAISAKSNGVSFSLGGSGGAAGNASAVDVKNTGNIQTGGLLDPETLKGLGKGSTGILAQSIGGGGGNGGFSGAFTATLGQQQGQGLAVSIGGKGGAAGDAGLVKIKNSGEIITTADDSTGIIGQSIGGGGGNGGFSLAATLTKANEKAAMSVSIGGFGGDGGNASTVDITNTDKITTVGDHSLGIFAQSIGGGGGNGGFSVAASFEVGKEAKSIGVSVGGFGGGGGDGQRVTVNNTAAITTYGNDAHAIQAQSIGGGGGNGGFSFSGSFAGPESKSLSVSLGGDGDTGGKGGLVEIKGTGGTNNIYTEGDNSLGIFAQSVGGGGGSGGFSAAIALGVGGSQADKSSTSVGISVGGEGGEGNIGGAVHIGSSTERLTGSILTKGDDSTGILAQSIGGGGGVGGFSVTGSITLAAAQQGGGPNNNVAIAVGGDGGIGNHGGEVLLYHSGAITTLGDQAYGIQAQSIGGGGGNGGTARAFNLQLGPKPEPAEKGAKPNPEEKEAGSQNKALALSIGGSGEGGGDGGKVVVDHLGDITTEGADAYGIYAQSIGGGGGDGGAAHQAYDELSLLEKFDRSKFTKNVKIVVGGSGGASGSGSTVEVTNDGKITTKGLGADGIFAQSIGGGGGTGGVGVAGATGTLGIGGGTGTTGNGGDVTVTVKGSIITLNGSSNGVFAQSVGGGGGKAGDVDRGLKKYANIGIGIAYGQDSGGGGNGGVVTVNSTADITTYGMASNGIMAQSVGGGGGVLGSLGNDFPILNVLNFAGSVGGDGYGGVVKVNQEGTIHTYGDASDGIWAQSAGGKDKGEEVTIKVKGDILADGAESNGIFLQSIGLAGNDDLKVDIVSGTIQGGTHTGSGVRFADGKDNLLTNRGTVTTKGDMALIGGKGNETIENYGKVKGSVDLSLGTNTFKNLTGGTLESGAKVILGAGNDFENSGTISTGGLGTVQITDLTGDFVQKGDSIWNFDLKPDFTSDRFNISGVANLGSFINKVNLNEIGIATTPGTYTLVTAASGLTGTFKFGSFTGGTMPVGFTFTLHNTDTTETLDLAESTGDFYWNGGVDGAWNGAFTDGISNWTRDQAGTDYIYGTPGGAVDVFFSSTNATHKDTTLGADFAINSLTMKDAGAVGIGGANTLTIQADEGMGIKVNSGAGELTLSSKVALGGDQSWTNNSTNMMRVLGDTISGTGQDLTLAGTGNIGITSILQTGTGSLTKDGTGTTLLYGASTYSGGTTLKNGVLGIGDSYALGTGNVSLTGGTLATINDLTASAHSELLVNIGGTYSQATAAALELRIIGPSGVNDELIVDGLVTLGGTLRPDYGALNYTPVPPDGDYTDEFNLIHSNTGISGQFDVFQDVHYDADKLLRWEAVYKPKDVVLVWNQHPFTELPGLTSNQYSTASMLNRAVGLPELPVPTPYNESTGAAINANPGLRTGLTYLNNQSLADLPVDYDLIAPEELTALFDIGRSSAQVEMGNIQDRLKAIRSGNGSGFDASGLSIQKVKMSANASSVEKALTAKRTGDNREADMFTPGADNRWGVFMSGSAESLDVGSDGTAAGFEINTGGITLGIDYRPNDNFAVGAFLQYINSDADLVNNGSLKVSGDKIGLYATLHKDGFYMDGLVAVGASSYDTRRLALGGAAAGNTNGDEFDAMISTGYTKKVGALSFGPLASLLYTRQAIDAYTETGSMLPLTIDSQAQSSLSSRLGIEGSYEFKVGEVLVVPTLSIAWQHEFLRGSYDLDSRLAAAAQNGFTVAGPKVGRDSLNLRAGVDIRMNKDFGVYVAYETEIGRTNYQLNSATVGLHMNF